MASADHIEEHQKQYQGVGRITLVLATILTGLSAGFFYTYEASVTIGLAEVGDMAYVETFQAINATVRNPAFGLIFFGPMPALALAAATNWRTSSSTTRALLLGALGFYLATVFVTVSGNVPLNNELAEATELTPALASAARSAFESDWNRLNLVRTTTVTVGFVLLALVPVSISRPNRSPKRTTAGTMS